LFLLFLSLFFTQQVLQACVHVTVAGTVGTWVSACAFCFSRTSFVCFFSLILIF
jgi:hypothetical protein